MNRRLLLLVAPLSLAVPAPAPATALHFRFCGTPPADGAPTAPRKEPCGVACHAMTCERQRQGRQPRG